jgi:hypothetical protein
MNARTLALLLAATPLLAQGPVEPAAPVGPVLPKDHPPLPKGHPPVGSKASKPAGSGSSQPAGSGSSRKAGSGSSEETKRALVAHDGTALVDDLAFTVPQGWTSVVPRSSMRKLEVNIPGSAGEATMTVFFFGVGGGGDPQANLRRWEGQLDADEGATPERKTVQGAETTIHMTSLDGTLKASPMSGIDAPVPGSRLMAAVVVAEGGPWFFKVTGPAATVRSAMPDFVEMLAKARALSNAQ